MVKTNYHTHCYLCGHAEGLPSDYIKRAVNLGFAEIGISDHGQLLPQWTIRMNLDEFHNIYLKDIDEAKIKYGDKIKIYKGLELEYYPDYDQHYQSLLKELDYLILGQHAVYMNDKLVDIYKGIGKDVVYRYVEELIDGIKSGYFRIIAHPDLFMYGYLGFWDEELEDYSRKIIEAAIANDVYLELNVNGARRQRILTKNNEVTWKYPYLEFWRLVSTYKDVKIIINADCHKINYLYDEVTEEVIKFANDLKLNICDKVKVLK